MIPPERIWILTNDFVRDEIVRQLPEVPPAQIIAEPAQRNTAPAIGLAAHILQSIDPNAVFGVFPSDHVIGKPKRYLSMAAAGVQGGGEGRDRGAWRAAALARNRLRLHRISEGHRGRHAGARSRC